VRARASSEPDSARSDGGPGGWANVARPCQSARSMPWRPARSGTGWSLDASTGCWGQQLLLSGALLPVPQTCRTGGAGTGAAALPRPPRWCRTPHRACRWRPHRTA